MVLPTANVKTFTGMLYPTVYRNFCTRQPIFAEQDAGYAHHTMPATNPYVGLPVGILCPYCYDAYVKAQ
eukprot:UN03325